MFQGLRLFKGLRLFQSLEYFIEFKPPAGTCKMAAKWFNSLDTNSKYNPIVEIKKPTWTFFHIYRSCRLHVHVELSHGLPTLKDLNNLCHNVHIAKFPMVYWFEKEFFWFPHPNAVFWHDFSCSNYRRRLYHSVDINRAWPKKIKSRYRLYFSHFFSLPWFIFF